MPRADIVKEIKVERTPRVMQMEGIFDVPPTRRSSERWQVDLPLDEKKWHIGLIVGPSGCGKTTIIKELFGDHIYDHFSWPKNKSVLDGFPPEMGIKEITGLLNSVGFSSPPAWVRPFRVLSNGEKFRVFVARCLAESGNELCVIDEFTSVVDRTVAKIGSAAVSKTVRKYDKKLIAVSCHYDIEEWLQPDWVYRPHDNAFEWRFLRRRPEIRLKIRKVHHSAWDYFKRYHYLTASLNRAAQCFVAYFEEIPVAFFAYLQFVNNRLKRTKRGSRVVCLPDYQGVGIGMRLEEYVAACLKALGWDYIGASSHPVRNNYCAKSKKWRMISRPAMSRNKGGRGKIATNLGRMMATFRYVGPPAPVGDARQLIG
ncbi:MAG: ABC transporter ATP-binding protein [Planctomycetota bacterium]|nr:MAG: ABC transporter ATP-binding protein [Planctomycetota bacterium]RLC76941.1 MAG: ABC transporter ATP-binding protein [Chloroflexota bacterium]